MFIIEIKDKAVQELFSLLTLVASVCNDSRRCITTSNVSLFACLSKKENKCTDKIAVTPQNETIFFQASHNNLASH